MIHRSLENNLLELWSIFDFCMPGFLDTSENFRRRYVLSGAETPDDIDGLRVKVLPFMLRRVKDEVAKELPPKTEQVICVPVFVSEAPVHLDENIALRQQA